MFIVATVLVGDKIRINTDCIVSYFEVLETDPLSSKQIKCTQLIMPYLGIDLVVRELPEQIDELVRKAQEPEIVYSCKD